MTQKYTCVGSPWCFFYIKKLLSTARSFTDKILYIEHTGDDVGTMLISMQYTNDVQISDPDDHLALPLSMSKWLYRLSWLSASTCCLAVYMQLFDLAIVPAAVLFTSIKYWRCPDYSWRRYVDIVTVQFAICYQIIRAAPGMYLLHFTAYWLSHALVLSLLRFMQQGHPTAFRQQI